MTWILKYKILRNKWKGREWSFTVTSTCPPSSSAAALPDLRTKKVNHTNQITWSLFFLFLARPPIPNELVGEVYCIINGYSVATLPIFTLWFMRGWAAGGGGVLLNKLYSIGLKSNINILTSTFSFFAEFQQTSEIQPERCTFCKICTQIINIFVLCYKITYF